MALAVITVAVYSPVFHYDFLTFDDQIYVTENPCVRSGLNGNSLAWAFHTTTSGNWIPLTWISHMLAFQCLGMKAGGHHLANVLFHAANAVLLFLLLQRMTGAIWRSALVAAFFAWHPAHVESVAWIAERKDVLSSFFGLLALWAYMRCAEQSKLKVFYGLSLALFALSLMAKPMLVTLPFVLLLLDFWPLGRMSWSSLRRLVVEKAPMFALSAACCAWTLWAQSRSHAVASIQEISLPHRLGHVFASYLDYIVMLVYPHDLAIYYPYPPRESAAMVAGGAAALALFSTLAIVLARRRPWATVGWFWFMGMLTPVIGLVQAGDQALADRYTYLPAIGLFIIVAWAGAELAMRHPAVKWFAAAAVLGMLAASWTQIHYWKDTRTVFEHALGVTRDNYVALTLLGSIRADDGDLNGAMEYYHKALRAKPNYSEGRFFLARGLQQQGKMERAKSECAIALRLNPSFEQAHILMGLLLAGEKKFDEAAAEYEIVLKANPRSATAHNDLARLLQSQGRLDQSIGHYLAALQCDSSMPQAHNNLGVLYLQRGRPADATAQLREALRLNPGNMETEHNLALALNQQQQWREAADLWQRIAAAQPADADAQYQCGWALSHLGKTREAMGCYAQAILLTPDFAEALDALAWIAATDPRPELRNGPQAVQMAGRACELTGRRQPRMLLTLAAACAETGRFGEAAAAARQAGDLAGTAGLKELQEKARRMRGALEKSQPIREPAGKPDSTAQ